MILISPSSSHAAKYSPFSFTEIWLISSLLNSNFTKDDQEFLTSDPETLFPDEMKNLCGSFGVNFTEFSKGSLARITHYMGCRQEQLLLLLQVEYLCKLYCRSKNSDCLTTLPVSTYVFPTRSVFISVSLPT